MEKNNSPKIPVEQNPQIQVEDQPVTPPEIIKPKKNLKAPILIAVFLLLISALGFFVFQNFQLRKLAYQETTTPEISTPSPIPDSTAIWTEYQVKDVNLTFKAPNEFYVQIIPKDLTSDSPTGLATIIYIQNYKFNDYPPENYYHLRITIAPVTLKTDLTELRASLSSVQDIKILEQDAVQGISEQSEQYITFFLKNEEAYIFATSALLPENKQKTDQILSTFKFTD